MIIVPFFYFIYLQLFPVSSKVHTTRCQAQGVITENNTQVVSAHWHLFMCIHKDIGIATWIFRINIKLELYFLHDEIIWKKRKNIAKKLLKL